MNKDGPNNANFEVDVEQLKVLLEQTKVLPLGERRLAIRKIINMGITGEASIDTPPWIEDGANFLDNIWPCNFGAHRGTDYRKIIDFNVSLSNGSLLTDCVNHKLLKWIKTFICVQVHPRYNGGTRKKPTYEVQQVMLVLQFFDWLLMNDEIFNIGEFGLSQVTTDNIKSYLIKNTSPPISTYLYDYPNRLANWLRKQFSSLTEEDFMNAAVIWEGIHNVPPMAERITDLNDFEVVCARTLMIKQGWYVKVYDSIRFNSKYFVSLEYKDTLHGANLVVTPPVELCSSAYFLREYPAIPVTAPTARGIEITTFRAYVRMIKKIAIVDANYCDGVIAATKVNGINAKNLYAQVVQKSRGRFVTLPESVTLDLLGDSFDFFFQYAQPIFKCMLDVLGWGQRLIFRQYMKMDQIGEATTRFITPELRQLGVTTWSIRQLRNNPELYAQLRSGKGLNECYHTLVGAMLVIIGSLAARRQSEIMLLEKETCLLPFKNPYLPENANVSYCLYYKVAKTGTREERESNTAGITLAMAKIIWQFIEFRDGCEKLGVIGEDGPLILSIARSLEARPLIPISYNRCLDTLCDYVQTPVINLNGVPSRYYIRQHQLRRFSLLAFFYGSASASLENLQLLSGHSDPRHIFDYLTEPMSGVIIRSAKAEVITNFIVSDRHDIENLGLVKAHLLKKFSVENITLKTLNEIKEDYQGLASEGIVTLSLSDADIEAQSFLYRNALQLIETKVIDLRPDFFSYTNAQGETIDTYKIVIRIGEEGL
ncbi:hypothetical protein [Pseudomonas sp. GM80]|uniref:hypothetical protein n=1 Tax=Pseudomonas sp. GM80 TaxID=1144339 RepID=UPI00026F4E4A|nr:hypothetical protein [Pseudomonas sp. GM80]EJN34416.1 hypothetical protein PMI37_01276 [Pseudomonas sp. GM80]